MSKMKQMKSILLGVMLVPFFAVAATPKISLEELFDKIGDQPGPFVVHLNCGKGEQTAELLKRDGIIVQGLDTDRPKIEAARKSASARKDYGERITFSWFDGKHLPFIDNSVNTIVASGK